ncbi:hypothetical protein K440DRAFT_627503 [Wilcoxina mikolae CBS 423.85]|nr:hypothetical protein K440DRAFT_627503 [Wilcoxina mikolae CBS 423.85]
MVTFTVTETSTSTTTETTTSISATTLTTTSTTTTTVTSTPSCPPKPPFCWYSLPIPDSGFEMPDTPEAWTLSYDLSKHISLIYATGTSSALSGKYVLKSVSFPGNTWGGTATKSITVCAGRKYRFVAWTKHLQGGGWAKYSINGVEIFSTKDRVAQEQVWLASGEWWTAPEGSFAAEVKIEIFGTGESYTLVDVDDVILRLAEE